MLVAIIGVVLFDVPSLMLGAEDSAAPFLLVYARGAAISGPPCC